MLNYLETNDKITNFVKQITGLKINQIREQNRGKEYVEARMITAYLFRRFRRSYPNIGRFMERDHTTIIHLIKRMDYDQKLKEKIDNLIYDNFPELNLE